MFFVLKFELILIIGANNVLTEGARKVYRGRRVGQGWSRVILSLFPDQLAGEKSYGRFMHWNSSVGALYRRKLGLWPPRSPDLNPCDISSDTWVSSVCPHNTASQHSPTLLILLILISKAT
jgi:hypothetical protein